MWLVEYSILVLFTMDVGSRNSEICENRSLHKSFKITFFWFYTELVNYFCDNATWINH